MMRTLAAVTLMLTMSGCATGQSGNAVSDALHRPLVDLADAVTTHGAPGPVVSAVRDVLATYEAVQ